MKIIVNIIYQRSYKLEFTSKVIDVEPNASIESVAKQVFGEQRAIERLRSMNFEFGGRILSLDKTLADYNIQENATINTKPKTFFPSSTLYQRRSAAADRFYGFYDNFPRKKEIEVPEDKVVRKITIS